MKPKIQNYTPVFDVIVREHGRTHALIFGTIWRFCQMKSGVCFASQGKMSKRVGISVRTFQRKISDLINDGYLERIQSEPTDKYLITKKAWELITDKKPMIDDITTPDEGQNDPECMSGCRTKKQTKKVSKTLLINHAFRENENQINPSLESHEILNTSETGRETVTPSLFGDDNSLLAQKFIEGTNWRRKLTINEVVDWKEGFQELREQGTTPEILGEAISLMVTKRYSIKNPQSVITFAFNIGLQKKSKTENNHASEEW